jgi:hypothetical protein
MLNPLRPRKGEIKMKKNSKKQPFVYRIKFWLRRSKRRRRVRNPEPVRILISGNLAERIRLVGKIEGLSPENSATMILEQGFVDYMVEKFEQQMETERREKNLLWKARPTRFERATKKFKKEHGIDERKNN